MPTIVDHQLSGILAKLVDRLVDLKNDGKLADEKVDKLIADYEDIIKYKK